MGAPPFKLTSMAFQVDTQVVAAYKTVSYTHLRAHETLR